jgi:hypothetical protein
MKTFLKALYILPVVMVMGIVGYLMTKSAKAPQVHLMTGPPFASVAISNLTANFFTAEGHLGPAQNDVFIEFRDSGGKMVNVGNVTLDLHLAGADAIRNSFFKVLPTATPGQYRVMVQPQVAGQWQGTLAITAPTNHAEASFPITVR